MTGVSVDEWSRPVAFSRHGVPEPPETGSECATAMARRLAVYLTDPSTIRAYVMNNLGQAPSLAEIRAMMVPKRKIAKLSATIASEEAVPHDAIDFRVRGIIPKKKREIAKVCAKPRVYATPACVMESAALHCGLRVGDITGRSRCPDIVRARNLVAAILRARGNSWYRIGALLGGRDHTTAMNAVYRFFERDLPNDEALQRAWESIAPERYRGARSAQELGQ